METLYHYCSVESFLAILQSKKIWLSDSTKMNDSHEGRWADQIVEKILIEKKNSMSQDEVRDFELGYNMNLSRPFLFCLSSEPDILSQWRAYANNATGVAIGFKSSIFPRFSHLPGSTNAAPTFNTSLWRVTYELAEQEAEIRRLYDRAAADPSICVAEGGKTHYQLLGAYMTGIGPLMKNPAFREEKEYRLIHSPSLLTDTENKHSVLGSNFQIGQRASDNQIVTYFEYPLPESVGIVQEVWIGPKSRLTAADVNLALSINGFGKTSVRMSTATYR